MVGDIPEGTGLYAGWDIARKRDLSVVWFNELVGEISATRGVLVMRNMPTPDQTEVVSRMMPRVHRLCIDKSGMGLPIFETMERAFYGKVEGITFTQQTKETMATHTKRRPEERKCRLPETVIVDGKPDDQIVWQNFRSVRKTSTALGQVRFDAAHDEKFGHADFFWAFALAESAVGQQPVYGLLEWYRQEAERLRAETSSPHFTRAEIVRELGRAQIRYAQDIGCFGAEKWRVPLQPAVVRPPVVAPAACPKCRNKGLSRYSGLVRCNPCGWQINI